MEGQMKEKQWKYIGAVQVSSGTERLESQSLLRLGSRQEERKAFTKLELLRTIEQSS